MYSLFVCKKKLCPTHFFIYRESCAYGRLFFSLPLLVSLFSLLYEDVEKKEMAGLDTSPETTFIHSEEPWHKGKHKDGVGRSS